MTLSPAGRKAKGDRAEREVLAFLRDHLGDHLVRARLEGSNDHGDVVGLPGCVAQVKNYADVARAMREGLEGAAEQKRNAGVLWGAAFVRRPGGRYVVCMDAEDWISMFRETFGGGPGRTARP